MSKASLAQWLERLETLHPREIDLGLERVSSVALKMNLLPATVPVITVAGTNGKGSTCAVLEAVLMQCGRVVGVSSSPHFLRFNERIRVAGSEVPDELIIAAFEQIEIAREDISLTYFEFATLAALWVFRERAVDVMVLEVGLGGRLDAANIVDATVAIVTSIALDHQDWLGDTREQIAVEKAGIFRAGQPAVIADPVPPQSLLARANELGVAAHALDRDFFVSEHNTGWTATLLNVDGSERKLPLDLAKPLLPVNIASALQALLLLGEAFSDEQLLDALEGIKLRGRLEHLEIGGRHYLLDVAHNLASVDKLLKNIDSSYCNGKTISLFSIMSDKDVRAVVQACSGYFSAWFLGDQPGNTRAMGAAELAQILREEGNQMISVSKNIRQAFRRAQTVMAEGDRLVVFGSFFTVAAVLPLLEKDAGKEHL
ncbi:MAG: bifunctional tetrahydrofolate synthase/dihydrofolate synthase [Halioglobus sp.]